MVVGYNIKKLRKLKGYSVRKLAELCNMSYGYIGDIENGRANPTTSTLESIAKALEVSVSNLLDEEDNFMNKSADEISEEFKELMPKIEKLSKRDKEIIKQMIDMLGGE